LQNILEEAIDNLEYQVKQTNAKISSDGLPTATIIPFQMRQLFQNLLSNSMKFTAAGEVPVIRITHHYANDIDEPDAGIRPADKYLIVEFKDNGIGFEQQYADKIFGLFNRLHGKQAYEGTGIGLAICRKAAENHGGSIRATSQPGKGATFTLYLPQ
jgi:signal transduction histidine kinase